MTLPSTKLRAPGCYLNDVQIDKFAFAGGSAKFFKTQQLIKCVANDEEQRRDINGKS